MSTNQSLTYINNNTINTYLNVNPNPNHNPNGIDDLKSSFNTLVHLFATGNKSYPDSYEEFEKVFNIIQLALREDNVSFIKLLKLYHFIKNDNSIKWLYYLCMLVIRMINPNLYSQVLEWSWKNPKDLLNLHRITNIYEPIHSIYNINTSIPPRDSQHGSYANKLNNWVLQNNIKYNKTELKQIYSVPIQYEIVLYGEQVFKLFIDLMKPEFDGKYNPMLIKYMSYESGYWEVESHLIWQYIEHKVEFYVEFKLLVNSDLELKTDLGTNLREIFKSSLNLSNQPLFSNKTRRVIKKCFNSHINLLDNLFNGIHHDKSIFGSTQSKEKEINSIATQLKRAVNLDFDRLEKNIQTYPEIKHDVKYDVKYDVKHDVKHDIKHNVKHNVKYDVKKTKQTTIINTYLVEGYKKYIQMLNEEKTQIKTTCLDDSQQIGELFYISSETFSRSTELIKVEDLIQLIQMQNIPLIPSVVLQSTIDVDELTNTFEIGSFSNVYDKKKIENIFQIFMKNIFTTKTK
jgi:hypothetical protein